MNIEDIINQINAEGRPNDSEENNPVLKLVMTMPKEATDFLTSFKDVEDTAVVIMANTMADHAVGHFNSAAAILIHTSECLKIGIALCLAAQQLEAEGVIERREPKTFKATPQDLDTILSKF